MGRSIRDLPIPELRFTYAFSNTHTIRRKKGSRTATTSDTYVYLLFNVPPNEQDEEKLLRDPIVASLFPGTRFGTQLDEHYAITNDVSALSPGFADDKEQRATCIEGDQFFVLDPKEIHNACALPHKYILGCSDCLEEEDDDENAHAHCRVKKLYDARADYVTEELQEDVQAWKHLKVKVGDYTFITPTYTQQRSNFAGRIVGINSVDFTNPEWHQEQRQAAAQTRARHEAFIKAECDAKCLFQAKCNKGRNYCSGAYDQTEKAYYDHILSRAIVKFTNKQIQYLLAHSGILDKKYNRREAYLSFRYRDGLEFIIGDIHRGRTRSLTFKEAQEIIKTHGRELGEGRRSFPVTKKLKALLIVLSIFDESPSMNSGWHRTTYPVRHLEYSPWCKEFVQYYYSKKHGVTSWTLRASELAHVYGPYQRVPFVQKSQSPVRTEPRYSWHNMDKDGH